MAACHGTELLGDGRLFWLGCAKTGCSDLGLMIGHPMPDLESDHAALAVRLVEFEGAVQVVWSLLIVVEHKMAADRAYFVRKAQTHSPSSHVYLVNTLVSKIAIAVVPEPMPVIVEPVFRKCVLRRRSGPQIVVNVLRNRLHGRLSNGVSPLIAEPSTHIGFPDNAVPHFLHRLADCGCGTALRSVLDDAVVPLGRAHQLLALP